MEAGCTRAPAWWQRKGGSGHTGRALGAHSWAASVRMWLGVPQGWTLPGNIMDWHVRRATVRARRTLRAGPRFVGGRRRRLSSKRSSIVVELAAQNSIKSRFSSRSHILWPLGSRFCASRRILTSLRGRVESTRDRELAVRQIPARIGQGTVERAPKGRGNPPSLAFSRGGAGQAGVLGAVERERGEASSR